MENHLKNTRRKKKIYLEHSEYIFQQFRSLILIGFLTALAIFQTSKPALSQHVSNSEEINILSRDTQGIPNFFQGSLGTLQPGPDWEESAVLFLTEFAFQELLSEGNEEFTVRRIIRDELGLVHFRIRQKINGLPLIGTEMIIHASESTREVYAVNGTFAPGRDLPTEATLEADEALRVASLSGEISSYYPMGDPKLVYIQGDDGLTYLAWQQQVRYVNKEGEQVDEIFADASTGALRARHPKIHRAKNWITYSEQEEGTPPWEIDCTNNQVCSDSVLQNIHDGASSIYDYYKAKFGRKSFDNADQTIRSIGHYGDNYGNAHWNGFLVYGDGDSMSGPWGNAFDIVGHEFTHGVTQFESGLIYQNESGALNEAWSDIFGAAAEAWKDGGISGDTWKIGEDMWTPGIAGDALRYMNNPTRDGISRDYYPERYLGSQDNGGVHWNSGIANLAYYLMVRGGQHPRRKTTVNVPAIGNTRAEKIFYRAQTIYLTPSSNFADARIATGRAALDLYGATYRDNVYAGWCAVGVGICPTVTNNAQFIAQSVPTSLQPGQTATAWVTMKNTGTSTWTRSQGFKLGSQNPPNNMLWGRKRALLPPSVAVSPGQQRRFNFTITAPSEPGTYNFQWRMLKEGEHWFGASSANKQITVQPLVNDAKFSSQSVPTVLTAGQTAAVSVTMKNTGTSTWTRATGFKLGSLRPQGNVRWGLNRILLPSNISVKPGESRRFSFIITAPSSPGIYNFQWRMLKEGEQWFGAPSANRQIIVQPGTQEPIIRVHAEGNEIENGEAFTFPPRPLSALPTSQLFHICNDGTGGLTIDNPTSLVAGQGFSQISTPPTTLVAPGVCTQFRVRFLVTSPGSYTGTVTIQNNDSDKDPYKIILRGIPIGCSQDNDTLCLLGDRFSAALNWFNPSNGQSGAGKVVTHPNSNIGGFFYFFSPTNVEVGIKILPFENEFLLIHGNATSLHYTLELTDTQTSEVKTYQKNDSQMCGGNDLFLEFSPGEGEVLFGSPEVNMAPMVEKSGTCTSGPDYACMLDNRFMVAVKRDGTPQPALELTNESGVFSFSTGSPSNPEVFVKIIDGRMVNGKFWIFFGSLTSQDYEVTITDTISNSSKIYTPPGAYCGASDIEAF